MMSSQRDLPFHPVRSRRDSYGATGPEPHPGKGGHVAIFVSLVNWTEQGIAGFKDTSKRVEAVQETLAKYGGSIKDMYWTIGPYDVVAVIEAPDDESATAALLEIGTKGNVRTSTMRGFTRTEFEAIIAKTG
jgi:uncharacterized protein with GYD domain